MNENQSDSQCLIKANEITFDMECIIEDFCPSDNFDIIYEYEDFYQNDNHITIYIDNSYITTTTLKAGYLVKDSCDVHFYNFSIKNNELSGNTSLMIYREFNLKLKEFKNDAICQINKETTDIIINCRVDLENNEEDYCSNINNDINVEKIRYKEYKYILVEDNILHLFNFDDLKTHTIEAGDLIRGGCEDNKYNFKIIDSIIYNNLTSDENINFDVMLSKPKEINASCKLPSNLIINDRFNISCEIEDSTDICPIDTSDDEILIIKENPDDILDKSLYFSNFTDKTTLIEVNAGNMSKLSYEKEEKKYYFAFEDSTIISSINKSISFNLPIEKDKIESQAQCHLNMSSSLIICEINNTNSENININIANNPSKDNVSIPEKIINFSNFENKQINTLIAGKIQKGSCENKIYSFYIKNSKLQNNFDNNFILELKEPNKNATCNITNFDETSHLCDIKCFFEETSSCEMNMKEKI